MVRRCPFSSMNAKIYAIAFAGCQKCVFVYSCNSYVLAGGGGGTALTPTTVLEIFYRKWVGMLLIWFRRKYRWWDNIFLYTSVQCTVQLLCLGKHEILSLKGTVTKEKYFSSSRFGWYKFTYNPYISQRCTLAKMLDWGTRYWFVLTSTSFIES